MNNNVLISEDELQYLKACDFTLHQTNIVVGLCPNCQKAIIVSGFVCPYCGYDNSYTIKEWKELKRKQEIKIIKREETAKTLLGSILETILDATNKTLSFPTEEMREAFYKNFQSEIESCNELL